MTNAKLTEKDFKQLLEETDAYGDSLNQQALLAIEEMYATVFGQEEFDEFVKRIRDQELKDEFR